MRRRHVKPANRILVGGLLMLFVLWTVIPIWLVVSNSFKTALDVKAIPPKFVFVPTIKNYIKAFTTGEFGQYFKNSIIVAGSTTLISVVCGAMGGYGLLIMKSKFATYASNTMLLGKLVPTITILIPLHTILFAAGLHGSYLGPILAHCSMNLPFVIWMMLGFMRGVPVELFESAQLDGARRMQVFWRILLPMLLPAIGSTLILSLQYSWNELMFSLQLTTMDSYTLPVGIGRFVGGISVDWGKSSAAATSAMLPVIVAGFLMQKYLVTGMTAGAVKG